MTQTALIIDDEPDIRELIAMSLDRIGLDTHTAANLAEARELLDNYTFNVCLTDVKLPDGNGIEFVKYAVAVQPHMPVAVITAHGNMDAAVEAMKNGAFDFVSKPVDLGLLRKLVAQAIKTRSANDATISTVAKNVQDNPAPDNSNDRDKEEENIAPTQHREISSLQDLIEPPVATRANDDFIGEHRLIGQSAPMVSLKKMIRKVARTNAPVWITGESGTGKEVIARLIHENGPRNEAPFVAVNCGAIPSELMESEMFGHSKGSFTGAHNNHDGLFKQAEGGTLFLDEVAELPLHMQVKLLRAIQERSIRPVGSSNEIATDVRILSASHKDLADEVELNNFRHDLYYRLNVISIRSPSLRDRDGDIVFIARHILKNIAADNSEQEAATLSVCAETALGQYHFPGNVRELENLLERAIALSDSQKITAEDLHIDNGAGSISTNDVLHHQDQHSSTNEEHSRIMHVLNQTRWNRKAAAESLGMTYRQLRYRIKQYGIDDER